MLPIADRELRIAARRPFTFWVRALATLASLVLWLVISGTNHRLTPPQLAKMVFTGVGVVAFGFALLSGIFLTSDCISEEKREGTLGLLFLTDLTGYDVVFGKLAATSLHVFYAMLAIFAVLAIPLLMGGVTAGEFWRLLLVLVATLFFSLSIGMLSSALNREARQAMAGTLLALMILAGLLPGLWWLTAAIFKVARPDFLLLFSPVYAFRAAYDSGYGLRKGALEYWGSLLTISTVAAGCLAGASAMLVRLWQREGLSATPKKGTKQVTSRHRFSFRAQCGFDLDPVFWLASRDRANSGIQIAVGLLLCVWALCLLASTMVSSGKEAYIICLFAAYAVHQIVKTAMATEATRQLNADRHSGALELLLVTPIPERLVLSGYARAFRQRFHHVIALLVMVNVCTWAVALCSRNLSMSNSDRVIFFELFLGGAIVLLFDFASMGPVGVVQAPAREQAQPCCARHLDATHAAALDSDFAHGVRPAKYGCYK